MEHKMNIDQLWQQSGEPAPHWQQFANQLAAMESKKRKEKNRVNFSLGATIAFVAVIAFVFGPLQWTTVMGIVLTEISMLLYLWQYNRHTHIRTDGLIAANALDYLHYLRREQTKQYYVGRKLMTAYFILLSLGVLLYMWEFAWRMPQWYGILAYGLAIGWFALNWLVFRPRILKKKEAELAEYIRKLEAIQQQWI